MSEAPIVKYSKHGRITVGSISTADVLDAVNVTEFGAAVMDYVRTHPKLNLLLDFHKVQYLSSAVLTELLRINKEVESRDGQLRLCSLNDNVRQVFEITNLDQVFTIYPDVPNAVKRFDRSLDVAAEDNAWEHLDKPT